MSNTISGNRVSATYDTEHFRIVVSPLKTGNRMDVPTVLRAMKYKLKFTNREIADFAGLSSTHKVFRLSFTNHYSSMLDEIKTLSAFLVIDATNNCAYFYDKDHKPESVTVPHVGPTIVNGEASNTTVTERIPVAITTRVSIKDDLNRQLTLKLVPSNGYLLGVNDVSLASPNMTYQVTSSRATLNALLRKIHYVPVATGKGSLTISVNDNENEANSVASTTVNVTIKAGETVSVPTLSLPKPPAMALNTDTALGKITVADEDGKVLAVRIAPFGCEVFGWASYLGVISQGKFRVSSGRPEVINADIAGLTIRPLTTNAYLGVELIYDKNVVDRQYLRFTAAEDTEEDEGNTSTQTPTETPTETQTQDTTTETTEEEPVLVVNSNALTGTSEAKVELGVSLLGSSTKSQTLTVIGSNCAVTVNGNTYSAGTKVTLTGTVDEINTKLTGATVTIGAGAGTVTVTYDSDTQVITVTPVTE